MTLEPDIEKGKTVANVLFSTFQKKGLFGHSVMPEDLIPVGMTSGTLDHILFLTLTVSIDYQRDAPKTWASARRTFEDPDTRYLFSPKALSETTINGIIPDLQKYGLSKKPRNDAFIWHTVGLSFQKKWGGDPRKFLESCEWDALIILDRLKKDQHPSKKGSRWDFPYLRGEKIGPLWIRMLHDSAGLEQIKKFENVPIPVDIHIARATIMLGVVRGEYDGIYSPVLPLIRNVWAECTKGYIVNGRPMMALDLDEPLWHLSKYGCRNRHPDTGYCPSGQECPLKNFCVPGKIYVSNVKNRLIIQHQ